MLSHSSPMNRKIDLHPLYQKENIFPPLAYSHFWKIPITDGSDLDSLNNIPYDFHIFDKQRWAYIERKYYSAKQHGMIVSNPLLHSSPINLRGNTYWNNKHHLFFSSINFIYSFHLAVLTIYTTWSIFAAQRKVSKLLYLQNFNNESNNEPWCLNNR